MINKQKILGYIGLSAKAGKIVSGTDACMEKIETKKVWLIIIAEDSAERTKKNIKIKCNEFNIPIIEFGTIEENSKAIGQKNKAVIGIRNRGIANEIVKNINGGDVIG